MPKLDERQPDSRIPTYLRLTPEARERFKSLIDQVTIHSLTEAVEAAARLIPEPKRKARKQ